MDISKSSNFERYMFDMVDADPVRLRGLWSDIDRTGAFDIAGTPLFDAVRASGFVAGASTHADRLDTIRQIASRHGVVIDPHTANAVATGLRLREPGERLLCLETALPAKFAETIREALGRDPDRPSGYDRIEALPQRVTVLDADAAQVRRYIEEHAQ